MAQNTYKKGFTLIELLMVIAIIGILSSVVLASINSTRAKARDANRISDMKQIQIALELYRETNGSYPIVKDSAGKKASTNSNTCHSYQINPLMPKADCWWGTHAESLATRLSPYIKLPVPPQHAVDPDPVTAWPGCSGTNRKSVYAYFANPTASEYKIYAFIEKSPCPSVSTQDGGIRPEAFEVFSSGGQAW